MIKIDFEKSDIIIACCPDCGGIVFACVNHPSVMDADTKKEIADMVIKGYRTFKITRADFKKDSRPFGHTKECARVKIATPTNEQPVLALSGN